MITLDTVRARHSVRAFTAQALPAEVRGRLDTLVADANAAAPGLAISAVYDEPQAFGRSLMARYGHFSGVTDYLCMALATTGPDLRPALGYHGERLVLELRAMGVDTCWVGLSYSKRHVGLALGPGYKLVCLIAMGYAARPGVAHRSRPATDICPAYASMPQWFRDGVDCALLAPTALNQQKFRFALAPDGSSVVSTTRRGFYARVDMGIARLHFEIGAGRPVTFV